MKAAIYLERWHGRRIVAEARTVEVAAAYVEANFDIMVPPEGDMVFRDENAKRTLLVSSHGGHGCVFHEGVMELIDMVFKIPNHTQATGSTLLLMEREQLRNIADIAARLKRVLEGGYL